MIIYMTTSKESNYRVLKTGQNECLGCGIFLGIINVILYIYRYYIVSVSL